MAKKKPHLRKSKLQKEVNIDEELAYTKKNPLQDGFKLTKTANGYEVVWQERLVTSGKRTFKTRKEAETYLRSLRSN